MALRLRLSRRADRDLDDILDWSIREFGVKAAGRYYALIVRALHDLQADPLRAGTRVVPDLLVDSARTYHVKYSRNNVSGAPVRRPRHILLFRVRGSEVYVGRILHDASDLPRHVPKSFRRKP